jgi:hypothetical protein
MSTQKHYRRCLEQLAADPPKRRVALIRSLLPAIEAALASGQNLKDIWEALETEGLLVSYHTFYMVVWRARKKRPATGGWGKQSSSSDGQVAQKTEGSGEEEKDPFANLRRLEQNRPGFHWRGTQRVQGFVHEKEEENDKSKR